MTGSIFKRARALISAAGRLLSGQRPGKPSRRAPSETGPYIARILSDAILFNEIPSPTEREAVRTEFILQRLAEFGYPNCERDALGNVTALIPSRDSSDEHVLLFAGVRCDDYSPLESMAKLETDRLEGRGVTESSLPVASLLVLAEYLQRNGVQYDRNVLLLFTTHDPGELDSPALEGFLQQWKGTLRCAAFLRGLELGGISERPLGTCKLTVSLRTGERDLMGGAPAASAISSLATVASRLDGIRWDAENSTFLNIARIEAGLGFGWFASEGTMEIEAFSPDAAALDVAKSAIVATIKGVTAESRASVDVSLKAYLPPGNPALNAVLIETVKRIYEKLRIKTHPLPVPTTAAILSSQGIPAVTLGMATGKKSAAEEFVVISSLEPGFRQLLMFLDACAMRHDGGTA